MGNSGSSGGGGGGSGARGRAWAHSYPRPAKVLPDRAPGQRLRLTDNGNILQGGGTLTNRHQIQVRPRSSSQGSHYEPPKVLYGSEPDLRFTGKEYHNYNDSPAKLRISRSRKKYKAPPAPSNGMDSSSPDSYQHWEMTGEVVPPVRRLRLFKTKAESSKKPQQQPPLPSPGPLQRSHSSPQFQIISQAELREAADRLRPVREPPVGKAADSPVMRRETRPNHNINNNYKMSYEARNNLVNAEHRSNHPQRGQRSVTPTPREEIISRARSRNNWKAESNGREEEGRTRAEGSTGKESSPEPPRRHHHNKNNNNVKNNVKTNINHQTDNKPWPDITPTTKPTAPVKKFYFGMNEDELNNSSGAESADNPEVERFAASIQRRVPPVAAAPPATIHLPSGSDSDHTPEESTPTISLQLRPILPRKQLDIPRFSPTAAWRLLSALESPAPSEEDDVVPLEDRIPAPTPHDKSGDSGISGDASPNHQDSTHNSQAAWTPQQDLEETSSDGGLESAPLSPQSLPPTKFCPRFSLSLPRDDRIAVYNHANKSKEDLKLKRSVSGGGSGGDAVAAGAGKGPLDGNWVLSRSVPNSLNNGHISLQRWSSSSPSSPEQEDELSLVKQPSFSYLATGGHVMYLPQYSMPTTPQQNRSREWVPPKAPMSLSCEDLSQPGQALAPSVLRALQPRLKSGRKFTFQSTVRQIERRRLADKLSKDAEQKERQRLNELEAMRRVEEEFQRKREREKADIRQQLRLYSLTQGREKPDGVDSPPPPSTQVLSEFRQPRRDYRDYTPNRYADEEVVEKPKRSMVHPQAVYQMPKSTQVYVTPHHHSNSGSGVGSNEGGERGGMSTPRSSSSDNYRRNFAQGALPHSLVSSDSEISQPNTRPTSRNLHRSRSRSASPPVRAVSPEQITLHLTQLKILQSFSPTPPPLPPPAIHPDITPATSPPPPPPPPQSSEVKPFNSQMPQDTPPSSRLGLSALAQPFVRNTKSFRPIAFNPTPNKVAQIAT